jgi:PHP family Zn ribbon phosphoesterase
VPLIEILAEALNVGVGTKTAVDQYFKLVDNLGSEFNVLLKAELAEIAQYSTPRVSEGIKKVRSGDIVIEPGYDGKFGVVKIWPETKEDIEKNVKEEKEEGQLDLFAG